MSLRNLARSVPRSAARFSTKAVRPQSSLRQASAFRPAWAAPIPRLTASFHMTAARRQDSDGMRWIHWNERTQLTSVSQRRAGRKASERDRHGREHEGGRGPLCEHQGVP